MKRMVLPALFLLAFSAAGNDNWPQFRGPDARECLGAVVSNGRIFYTSQASGFVVSQTFGPASRKLPAVWERP